MITIYFTKCVGKLNQFLVSTSTDSDLCHCSIAAYGYVADAGVFEQGARLYHEDWYVCNTHILKAVVIPFDDSDSVIRTFSLIPEGKKIEPFKAGFHFFGLAKEGFSCLTLVKSILTSLNFGVFYSRSPIELFEECKRIKGSETINFKEDSEIG